MPESLAELQRSLARHVLGGEEPELRRSATAPPGADVDARLAVYAQGYPARLQESLREAYPALCQILGQSTFAALVDRYAAWVPSGWCNLNRVGVRLPECLAEDPLTTELPFLPDLARLEWAVIECFNAATCAPFDLGGCEGWGLDEWAEARIGFQPGTAIISSAWPIHALREARHLDREQIDVDLTDRPESVLIHREGLDVVARLLDAGEAHALERLVGGGTLGEVMAELGELGASPDAVVVFFGEWAQRGLVVSCGREPAYSM